MAGTLTPGTVYNVDALRPSFLGWWRRADVDVDIAGYHLDDYFDAEGRYRGPDAHGVEPFFGDAMEPLDVS